MTSLPPCIQPTYEELKQDKAEDPKENKPGIQPTYEELKPHIAVECNYSLDVSSLPMRN